MAHSFVSFRGQDVRVHDLDLSVICLLIIEEANQSASASGLNPMFAGWIESLRFSGAGCIDLQLDSYLTSPDCVEELRALFEKAIRRLAKYDAIVPADAVNDIARESGVKLNKPYRVEVIRDTLLEITPLLGT